MLDLAENPSTGYRLRTTARPSFLTLLSSRYTATAVAEGVAGGGGGGRRVLTYRVATARTAALVLVHRRSFGPSASDERFRVRVSVKR